MELQYFRYFHEVAKQKSFSGAAKKLHVSQPAVSKVIKQLEDSLGSALIDRRTRGFFKLTDLGENVFQKTQTIFEQVDQIVKSAKNEDPSLVGDLHVGASDYIASTFLPKKMKALLREDATIKLKMMCSPSTVLREKLLSGELDVALFFNDDPHPALEYTRLESVQFIAVMSPALLSKALKDQTFIGCTSPDYHRTYPALELLKILRLLPKKVIEANNFHAQKELVKTGFGYGVFAEFAIEGDLKNGSLIQIGEKTLTKQLILARRKGRSPSPLSKHFESILVTP